MRDRLQSVAHTVSVAPAQRHDIEETFPLVPRLRPGGLEHGPVRGLLRGPGSEVAGSRAYHPGDDIRSIDWAATARLSAARGTTELVVRERYADTAPRVVLVVDRRPSMALYPSPWLSKPRAVSASVRLVLASARAARAPVGTLTLGAGDPAWHPPGYRRTCDVEDDVRYDAAPDALARGLGRMGEVRGVAAGTFVFVVSDYLEPPPEEGWIRLLVRRLDVIPVVVQDSTWEASFPEGAGGLLLPLADPASGRSLDVRVSRSEAARRRTRNEERLASLLHLFDDLGLDHVRVTSHQAPAVLEAFTQWAEVRHATAGRAW